MFVRGFIVLEWLAVNAAGMTVGELQRACKEYSKGQIQRILTELEKSRFVQAEMVPHGGTGKRVYRLSRNVAVNCEILASNFLKQEVAS